MSLSVRNLLIIGALFAIMMILAVLAKRLGLIKPSAPESLPYHTRDRLLSPAETLFFTALRDALPIAFARESIPPLLFAKVRLSDLFQVKGVKGEDASSRRTSAQNRINQKHCDFVICHPQTSQPLLAIELDDSSHDRQSRRDRDEFVDAACAAAALPILHVRCASRYDPRDLALQIEELFRGPTQAASAATASVPSPPPPRR